MANPQCENGHTKIANEIMKALCKSRISGECYQILNVIFFKTYGWHKKEDEISISQFVEMTGINKSNVCRGLNKLIEMNIVIKKDNKSIPIYCFNKDYDSWKLLSKKITLSKKIMAVIKKDTAVIKKDNDCYQKRDIQKQSIYTKASFTKAYTVGQDEMESGKPDDVEKNSLVIADNGIPYAKIVDYLNERTDSNYKASSKKTRTLIHARWAEGARLDDFLYVIDIKAAEWLKDIERRKYLRPETLFGTKFESYLNQKPAMKHAGAYEYLRKQGVFDDE